jgi:RNA 3'-terminal phosphate cyclase (ATP)
MAAPGFVEIDGSLGEGGGQVLRTSMALSALTGQPVRIRNIRAKRPKPGLARQHLVAVQAAASLSGGVLEGDALNSTELTFKPGPSKIAGGDFKFDIGSAGSVTLVLQTVLPLLLFADTESTVTIIGGTHNPLCPPFDFLHDTFIPILARAGFHIGIKLVRHGFYPAGGGCITASVRPLSLCVPAITPISLLARGAEAGHSAMVAVANMPQTVADNEAAVVRKALDWRGAAVRSVRIRDATGPGNVVLLQARFEHVTETVTVIGERRASAEEVAGKGCAEMARYLAADAPVGEHLADQLLLLMVLGVGGTFRATEASLHFTTNIDVIHQFLGGGLITYGPDTAVGAAGSSVGGGTGTAAADSAAASAGAGGIGPSAAAGGAAASATAPGASASGAVVVTVRPWKRPG